jgi:hypothetical protein
VAQKIIAMRKRIVISDVIDFSNIEMGDIGGLADVFAKMCPVGPA